MWKAWRKESQQRAPVDCLWRRLWAAQAAGIESQVLILVTHPSAPQATPIKSICGRMIGFTQHSVIITPLHASDDGSWDFMIFFFQYLTEMTLFPKNEDICVLCDWFTTNILSHTLVDQWCRCSQGALPSLQQSTCVACQSLYLNKQSKTSNSQPAVFKSNSYFSPPISRSFYVEIHFCL